MRANFRSFAITIVGAASLIGLGELVISAGYGSFENPNPSLFARLEWLWVILAAVLPGIGIGLFAAQRPAILGALAYVFGEIVSFCYHDGEREVPHRFLPSLQFWPVLLRDLLLIAVLGAVMGVIGSFLRRRLALDARGISMSEPTTEMPRWRAVIRRRLMPYRGPLAAVALVAMIAFVANEIFGWGLLGFYGRKSEGVAMLIGLLMYLFVLPTLDELRTWRRKEG